MNKIIPHSITDLYHTLGMSTTNPIDFTILNVPNIHPEIPFKSPVLRAEYFSIIITKKGSGVYNLDDNRFPFGDQSIYFTNPGHIKSYELFTSEKAQIIMLTEKFLVENVHPQIYEEFPFLLAEIVPPNTQTDSEFEEFELLFRQIDLEFNTNSKYKNKIVGNMILVLLIKIKERFWANYNPLLEGEQHSRIVKSFKKLIESEFKKIKSKKQGQIQLQAQYFAEQLNLHPNYLNSVLKSKTGRTLSNWISQRTLSTAKSLLVDSSLSLKEISYLLGYSEPTHFSRFFKKNTDVSPRAFRKAHQSI
ncbi:helix-turn-helix transcriptional regulator [Aquimarina sp. U1-2]|uniref:AraC family transcriptional regulator n=1 Tax=Aquimarina sp. U1-2 TaxID=2823141 RepID=UPI001AED0523|nr:AraC family transcriptional regulator [Aquimarina sp. U1-2]MBP2831533.1 helix-turn-helix transcriptional regulator [Aquimarina sp. U1-2]